MPHPRARARHPGPVGRALVLGLACGLSPGAALLVPPAPTPATRSTPARAPGDSQVRPGEWNASKVPEGWLLVDTEHYQVQSHVGSDKAERLARHLEGMLSLYEELLPTDRRLPRFVLKIFRDREAYLAYGGEGIAHYDRVHKELACYDTGLLLGVSDFPVEMRLAGGAHLDLDENGTERLHELFADVSAAYTTDVADVLSHEGWHQYFHEYTVSWVDMPSWIDEGVGDWFATARLDPETGRHRLGSLNHHRLRDIRAALRAGEAVGFAELLDFEQADYYARPDVYYAQGWSMVAFLMQSPEPGCREVVPDLIRHFRRSKDFRRSTERAFGKLDVDLDTLEARWSAWVMATSPHDPLRQLAREFGDRLDADQLVAPAEWKQAYRRLVLEEAEASGSSGGGSPSTTAGDDGGAGAPSGAKSGAGERN